ncbi:hypothetical protein [Streptomyces sp. NBC_00209]|uniref:hypothetical protein n=1 Tax=Streptomyces sp. NBC_00209 TaxID=2975682 RepID=UPI00324B84AD
MGHVESVDDELCAVLVEQGAATSIVAAGAPADRAAFRRSGATFETQLVMVGRAAS